ncbi:MAG: HK97 family phage prohead protease [Syntrophomonas sp.]
MKRYGINTQELRAIDNAEGMTLEGVAIVYNQPTTLFTKNSINYREQISSKSLDGVNLTDVPLRYYNHDHGFLILARTRNQSLKLDNRPDGLHFTVALNPIVQAHKDVYELIRNGLINKMSFGFIVGSAGDNYDNQQHIRTVTQISNLLDIAIVDQPAYEQTTAEARNQYLADVPGNSRIASLIDVLNNPGDEFTDDLFRANDLINLYFMQKQADQWLGR